MGKAHGMPCHDGAAAFVSSSCGLPRVQSSQDVCWFGLCTWRHISAREAGAVGLPCAGASWLWGCACGEKFKRREQLQCLQCVDVDELCSRVVKLVCALGAGNCAREVAAGGFESL